jgi:hypothetical protein
MKRLDTKSLLTGCLVGVSSVLIIGATTSGRPRTNIDYKVVSGSIRDGNLQERMNSMQGWELASVERLTDTDGFAVFHRPRR